jgi:uncharacterized protein (TIGR04255 family)
MSKKMKNAPIYFALAHIRFNPLVALDTYVPAIQERLRKAGYPDFQPNQVTTLIVSGPEVAKPSVSTRYLFLNAQKTSGFVIDQNGISFQTTDYDTFDPFIATLFDGLTMLHAEAGLDYSDRVGIRFLDAICPLTGETISQYLRPYILGLSDQLTDRELVHSLSETRTRSGKTVLVGRAIIVKQEQQGVAFPQDLQPVPVTLLDKFNAVKGEYAILDTDSWIEDRQKFDLGALDTTCKMLHDNMWRSFDLMITPHAKKIWG